MNNKIDISNEDLEKLFVIRNHIYGRSWRAMAVDLQRKLDAVVLNNVKLRKQLWDDLRVVKILIEEVKEGRI